MVCQLNLQRQQPPEMRRGFEVQKTRQSPHEQQEEPSGHIDGDDNVPFYGKRRTLGNSHGEIEMILKMVDSVKDFCWGRERAHVKYFIILLAMNK